MKQPRIFLDSSALIAGVLSSSGAARALLVLSENERVLLFISEQVKIECERAFLRKAPQALPAFNETIQHARLHIIENPTREEVQKNIGWIRDETDVPILLAALACRADFLVTHNRKHFLDDPQVAEKTSLRLGTPADALEWLRTSIWTQSL